MTINPFRRPDAGSTTAAAITCPSCRSGEVRHSRWRREEGLLRLLFFSRYRCRDCRARFSRFNVGAMAVIAVLVLTIGAAIGAGWALRDHHYPEPEPEPDEPALAEPYAPSVTAPEVYPDLSDRAERGEASAQASLASAYLTGRAVTKDLAQALKWAEKSALQGDADGQYTLGSMYLAGRGTLQNFETAFEWFEAAARQNHAESQYRLGNMYRSGHGVGADKIKAYVWFSLAAAQGHHKAADDRDSLLHALTSEQIALAQREAQDWRPSSATP